MQPTDTDKKLLAENMSETYDLYAPAVYGKISRIIHKKSIANKILEKVFTNFFIDKNVPIHKFQTPLISLLNHSREKSYKTIKALTILSECCAGTTRANDKLLVKKSS